MKKSAPSIQSVAQGTENKENLTFKKTVCKNMDLIIKGFIAVVGMIFAFILAINKVESSMFYQVVWVGSLVVGGSTMANAVISRLPPLKSKNTEPNT